MFVMTQPHFLSITPLASPLTNPSTDFALIHHHSITIAS